MRDHIAGHSILVPISKARRHIPRVQVQDADERFAAVRLPQSAGHQHAVRAEQHAARLCVRVRHRRRARPYELRDGQDVVAVRHGRGVCVFGPVAAVYVDLGVLALERRGWGWGTWWLELSPAETTTAQVKVRIEGVVPVVG